MQKFNLFLLTLTLIFIPLYPKFPLIGIGGSYVFIRLDDLVVALVFGIFLAQSLKRKFSDFFTPMSRAIFLYLFMGFVATFSAIFVIKSADLSQGFLHTFRRLEYFSLFFCGFAFVKSVQDIRLVTRVILLVSFIVALYGLGQAFLDFPVISTTNSEFSKGLALTLGTGARINSTFAGHYDLAAFCIFPLLLVITLLPWAKHKFVLLAIAGAVYWSLLLSASRITFAAFVITAGLLLIIIRKKIWLVPFGFIILMGIVFSPQLRGRYLEFITNHLASAAVVTVHAQSPASQSATKNVSTIPDALAPTAQPEDRSFNIRLQAEWPRAIRAFYKNPILGTGFSSVGLAVDNDLLRSLAETGLLGTLGFILIFFRYFRSSLPVLIHYPSKNPTITASLITAFSLGLVGLIIIALFIDVFTASKIALTAWCFMGISQKAKQLYNQ